MIPIDDAILDQNLLGAALGDPATWQTWLVVLRAAFGLPLSPEDRAIFTQLAGDREPPAARVRELWTVAGRRSGKSRTAAAIATYLAAIAPALERLSAGEQGVVAILAANRGQAKAILNYTKGFLEASPILRQQIVSDGAEEITLAGNIVIGAYANSFRTLRSRTLIAAILDEVAFWRSEESANPDVEVYRAALPALATTGGMLIALSSPYRMAGLLHSKFSQCFAASNDQVLVVKAPTLTFNPTLDAAIIDQAHEDDPEAARSEWQAEFRGDLASYIDREILDSLVDAQVYERPPVDTYRYSAFVDVSGGSADSCVLAISHRESDSAVLDVVREVRPPFSTADVVSEFALTCKKYRCFAATGDAYGAQWVQDAFQDAGIRYVRSALNRSEIYLNALGPLRSRLVRLLDNKRLVAQVAALERRVRASGKDTVDHGPGGHDDVANAALGSLVAIPSRKRAVENDPFAQPRHLPRAVLANAEMKTRLRGAKKGRKHAVA